MLPVTGGGACSLVVQDRVDPIVFHTAPAMSEVLRHWLRICMDSCFDLSLPVHTVSRAWLAASRCPNGKEVDCHRDRIVLQPVPWWPPRSGAPAGLLSTAVKLLC